MVLTKENCEKLNALVRIMRLKTVTKQEVMGIFNTNERTARDMLSEVAKKCPVVSLSNGRGYRIINRGNPTDYQDARHAYNENKKRAIEILKRNDPLSDALGLPRLMVVEQ